MAGRFTFGRGVSPKALVLVLCAVGIAFGVAASAANAQPGGTSPVGSDIVGENSFDGSGWDAALSDDASRVAVGEPSWDSDGRVRVFDLVNGEWAQVGQSIEGQGIDDVAGDAFGWSVDLSSDGSRLIVGARAEFFGGYVTVYDLVGSTWVQVGDAIEGPSNLAELGYDVAITADGSRIVTATRSGGANAGVQAYELGAGMWTPVGSPIPERAQFIALTDDGSRVLVSTTDDVGLYDFDGQAWAQVGPSVDRGAVAIADDGSRWAVSSTSETSVYELDANNEWQSVGTGLLEATGAVALSGDGERVATVGSGERVQTHELVNGTWALNSEVVLNTDGTGGFGAVLLNNDGSILVRSDSRFDNRAGVTRVFSLGATPPPPPVVLCNDLVVTVDLALGEAPTDGDDVIRGTAGDDVIDALGGNDTICALGGDDTVDAGHGFDRVFAGAGDDMLTGGWGNDLLIGGLGQDTIFGDRGNDRIQGGDDADELHGGYGNDIIRGGNGNDILRAGGGDDRVWGNLGNDRLLGDDGDDVLRGGAWLDTMHGGLGTDDGCTLTDPSGLVEVRIDCEGGVFGR